MLEKKIEVLGYCKDITRCAREKTTMQHQQSNQTTMQHQQGNQSCTRKETT
jgi:hypothetical protein